MDMFGGLTRTSSRIAIAAALGLTLGGFAFKATPAKAADLGGDCCADLEERVAELEATTVRKGNKKVSVTLSGWVVKTMNWWDDGEISSFAVGDKDADLASRFAITGSAQIAPGWSGGFNITVVAPGDTFGIFANQNQEFRNWVNGGISGSYLGDYNNSGFGAIRTLYSYIYIKSDTLGTLNWGYLSPASDNPAVLADISGTVIESNAVFFEGAGFFLRPKGALGSDYGSLAGISLLQLTSCTNGGGGVGADCFGAPRPAVRYDSPTWGGFRFETSYGTVETENTPDHNFWDVAIFYTADWNSIKLSAAYAYTHEEHSSGANCNAFGFFGGCGEDQLHQVGASIMHKPSGLGIYGLWQTEIVDGLAYAPYRDSGATDLEDTEVWYLKPFWRKAWSPIGATVLYGEYGQYNDQFGGLYGTNLCGSGSLGNSQACFNAGGFFNVGYMTESEVQRWGLGVVQEIDSAAMHVFARWQHQEAEATLKICGEVAGSCFGGPNYNVNNYRNQKVDFDSWDLFQVGGIIFF
jgi:hypothetical protein